jgi:hypothetical protein
VPGVEWQESGRSLERRTAGIQHIEHPSMILVSRRAGLIAWTK